MSVPDVLRSLRVALVHDYLNQAGGAEKVVEVFAEMFPEAPVYTSVYDRENMPEIWKSHDVRTSFLQKVSPRVSVARALVPFYPTAFELFDLRSFDLVLSSTTAFAKSVITRPETCHICYCNNPTRFLWMYHDYFEHDGLPRIGQALIAGMLNPLRTWDFVAAQRVDFFIAGSRNASRRITKYYRRQSDVVQAPIDGAAFETSPEVGDFFLVVARLQPYKRIDLAVEACNRLGAPLRVIGEGPDRVRLESMAGPTVQFLGRVPDAEVRAHMARCRALLFPGEEDFGLTPLETQASGRPVIAFGAGGALETVIPGETGEFFYQADADALASVMRGFRTDFDPQHLRAHALRFDKEHFKERMYAVIARRYQEYRQQMGV
ncbi:MAG: glycosyltransferase [Chloroflexota bacterium]